MELNENQLINNIKAREFYGVYYFYGEERFLTETYSAKVISKSVSSDENDINIVRFDGSELSLDVLYDTIEGYPMFAEKKAVLINDLDCEKLSEDENEKLKELLKIVPPYCVVIISQTDFTVNTKKPYSKKLVNMLTKEKNAAVCQFKALTPAKVAELVIKKAAKNGCVISRNNALKLAELTLCDLTLCSNETEKLCCYIGTGEITEDVINSLVSKQLDTNIFSLANAIANNDRRGAFAILDDLFAQKAEAFSILPALATAYLDYYRAAAALSCGKTVDETAEDFGCTKRIFSLRKAFSAVSETPISQIRKNIAILADADIKMKSSGTQNSRIILEKTIVMLFAQKKR